eukprot:763497-Hanusia_phi.AAC.3
MAEVTGSETQISQVVLQETLIAEKTEKVDKVSFFPTPSPPSSSPSLVSLVPSPVLLLDLLFSLLVLFLPDFNLRSEQARVALVSCSESLQDMMQAMKSADPPRPAMASDCRAGLSRRRRTRRRNCGGPERSSAASLTTSDVSCPRCKSNTSSFLASQLVDSCKARCWMRAICKSARLKGWAPPPPPPPPPPC